MIKKALHHPQDKLEENREKIGEAAYKKSRRTIDNRFKSAKASPKLQVETIEYSRKPMLILGRC